MVHFYKRMLKNVCEEFKFFLFVRRRLCLGITWWTRASQSHVPNIQANNPALAQQCGSAAHSPQQRTARAPAE